MEKQSIHRLYDKQIEFRIEMEINATKCVRLKSHRKYEEDQLLLLKKK